MRPFPGLLIVAFVIGLSACSQVHPDSDVDTDYDGLQKGPGIFTGKSGAWTVIRK